MSVSITYKKSGQEQFNLFSPTSYSTVLSASTEQTLTVPYLTSSQSGGAALYGGANPMVTAVISVGSTSSVFVRNNATVSYPSGTFGEDSGQMVNSFERIIKQVKTGDVLHFITNGANVPVNVVFYLSN